MKLSDDLEAIECDVIYQSILHTSIGRRMISTSAPEQNYLRKAIRMLENEVSWGTWQAKYTQQVPYVEALKIALPYTEG